MGIILVECKTYKYISTRVDVNYKINRNILTLRKETYFVEYARKFIHLQQ